MAGTTARRRFGAPARSGAEYRAVPAGPGRGVVDYVFASRGKPGNRGKVTDWARHFAGLTDAQIDEILAGPEPTESWDPEA